MIYIERDSSGRTYQIWKQEQLNSCGVASAWMARGIAWQMSLNEGEWDLAQQIYCDAINNGLAQLCAKSSSGPMSLNPSAFPQNQSSMESTIANFGFYGAQLAKALRTEGLKVEHVGFNGLYHAVDSAKISVSKPAIALVYWDNNGGGHFVVVGRATRRGLLPRSVGRPRQRAAQQQPLSRPLRQPGFRRRDHLYLGLTGGMGD